MTIAVVAKPHPFRETVTSWQEQTGVTLAEIVEKFSKLAKKFHIHAEVSGVPVPQDAWHLCRPRNGDIVNIRVIPEGGKGGWSQLAALGLGAGSLALAGILGRAGKSSSTSSTASSSNTLAPPVEPAPDVTPVPVEDFGGQKDAIVPQIVGVTNQANALGKVPRVYGTYRIAPPIAAVPYYVTLGGEQYLYVILTCGYGQLDISDMRIGDIPISVFEAAGVLQKEIRYGTPTDTPITIYPSDVAPITIGNKITTVASPVEGLQAGSQLSIDLSFPKGIYGDDQGTYDVTNALYAGTNIGTFGIPYPSGRVAVTATFEVGYRLKGTVPWSTFSLSFPGNSSAPVKWGTTWNVPVAGIYEVYIKQTGIQTGVPFTYDTNKTIDNTYYVFHHSVTPTCDANWDGLNAISTTSPISTILDANGATVPMTYIALKVKASALINGTLDNLTCLCKSYLKTYNGSSWTSPVITANPAWVIADILCGYANNSKIPYSTLDGAALKELADWCDAQGYTFNDCIDQPTTIADLVRRVASCAQSSMNVSDGLIAAVADKPRGTIAMMFTASNTNKCKMHLSWPNVPDGIRGNFVNPNSDSVWPSDIRTVYDDGKTQANSSTYETHDMRGVTDPAQVYKLLRYQLAAMRLRRRKIEIDVDLQHIWCNRMDLALWNHDTTLTGLQSGNIESVIESAGYQTGFKLDQLVYFDPAQVYEVRVRQSDNTYIQKPVVTGNGWTDTITFVTPISTAVSVRPAVGNLVAFGYQNKSADLMLVESIQHNAADLSAHITLIDYNPAVYNAASGAIPLYTPNVSTQHPTVSIVAPPVITSLISDESVIVKGSSGTLISRIQVSFNQPTTGGVAYIETQYSAAGTDNWIGAQSAPIAGSFLTYISPVEDGVTYDIRAKFVTAKGKSSDFTVVRGHTVVGKSTPPPNVPQIDLFGTLAVWNYDQVSGVAVPVDFAGFELRYNLGQNDNWSQGVVISKLWTSNQIDMSILPAGAITLMVKAVDVAGNVSDTPAKLFKNVYGSMIQNAVETIDFSSAGAWSNVTITGGSVVGGVIKASANSGKFWQTNPFAKFWSANKYDPFWTDSFKDLVIEFDWTPRSNLYSLPFNVFLQWDSSGVQPIVQYKRASQAKFWSANSSATFWGTGTSTFWKPDQNWQSMPQTGLDGAYEKYKFRLMFPGGLTRAQLNSLSLVVDMPDVTEEVHAVIAGSGSPTLTQNFRKILSVVASVAADASYPNAFTAQVEYPYAIPPVVHVYDKTGTPVNGRVSLALRGY